MRDLRAFQPGKIGNLTIKNRLVRSATFEYMGRENGEVSDGLFDLYRNLAMGGVGLIVTGFASVHPYGYVHPQQMRMKKIGTKTMQMLSVATSAGKAIC